MMDEAHACTCPLPHTCILLNNFPSSPPLQNAQEFSDEDDVELYILTKPFADSGSDFAGSMKQWAREHLQYTDESFTTAPAL